MKRIYLTALLIAALLTIPMLASAQAGFRGDGHRYGTKQHYSQQCDHGKGHHKLTKHEYRRKAHHDRRNLDCRHEDRRITKRYSDHHHYQQPVVRKHVVRDHRSIVLPLPPVPHVVLGLPNVAIKVGW